MKKDKHYRGGCLHCPRTEDELAMDTILYSGFGGYTVKKDGKLFYSGDPQEDDMSKFKTLADIEKQAKRSPKSKWEVELSLPLRGATWRRKRGKWLLVSTNQGFA